MTRRFPAPWSVRELEQGFVVVQMGRLCPHLTESRRQPNAAMCHLRTLHVARAVHFCGGHLEAGRVEEIGDFVFPGAKRGQPLSATGAGDFTVHGFRSAFRDWAGERTNFPREVAEAALTHVVGDLTEQAYRCGDALEKRRALMRLARRTAVTREAMSSR